MKIIQCDPKDNKWVINILICILMCAFNQSFPEKSSTLLYVLVIAFGGLGCLQMYMHGIKGEYTRSFLLLCLYLIIIGLVWGIDFNGDGNRSLYLKQDLRYLLLFFLGTMFASTNYTMSIFHSMMRVIAFLAIVCGVYGLLTFDMSVIESRENAYTNSYFMWWMSTACYAYCGYYALIVKKERLLFFGAFAIYSILGLMMLKRSAFINIIMVFLIYSVVNNPNKLKSIFIGIATFIIFIAGAYIIAPDIFRLVGEALLGRFESVEDASELDRNIEMAAYWSITDISHLIFGRGAGNFVVLPSWGQFTQANLLGALHEGWANIIYKGGIIYILYYIILYKNIFRNLSSNIEMSSYSKVCLGVALSSLLSLIYEGSWTYTLDPFCISAPIFYIASTNLRNEFSKDPFWT